jgi:hypothetical protein
MAMQRQMIVYGARVGQISKTNRKRQVRTVGFIVHTRAKGRFCLWA